MFDLHNYRRYGIEVCFTKIFKLVSKWSLKLAALFKMNIKYFPLSENKEF